MLQKSKDKYVKFDKSSQELPDLKKITVMVADLLD